MSASIVMLLMTTYLFLPNVFASTISWNIKSPLPTARHGLGVATASNGKIYAIGGATPLNGITSVNEEYDPVTDSWSQKASISTLRWGLRLVNLGNTLYAIGGTFNGNGYSSVESYDPVTDSWSQKASMNYARHSFGAVQANGKIYVIGGAYNLPGDGHTYTLSSVEEYDPASDVWTIKNDMPTSRGGLVAVMAANGKIYVIGGYSSDAVNYHSFDTVEEYDPITDSWSSKASMPAPRHHLAGFLGSNEKIYIAGGTDSLGNLFGSIIEYDVTNNTWTQVSDNMPVPDYDITATTINGKAYIIGGNSVQEGSFATINSPPIVGAIVVNSTPTQQNTNVNVSANFSDINSDDTHSAIWDWGDGNISTGAVAENNGLGSTAGSHAYSTAGNYIVTLTVVDNHDASSQQTASVVILPEALLSSLSPAKIWISGKNAHDSGAKYDLKAEAYAGSTLISSGILNSVDSSGTGFGHAKLSTIPFDSFSPVSFPSGTLLTIKVYARNACSGSGQSSPTTRLWYNDSSANSQFGVTIDTISASYYLSTGSVLGASPGTGPISNIDIAAGSPCSPFKLFDTWSIIP